MDKGLAVWLGFTLALGGAAHANEDRKRDDPRFLDRSEEWGVPFYAASSGTSATARHQPEPAPSPR